MTAPHLSPPNVEEIAWDLPPLSATELVDLGDLTADETFLYAGELQRECATLRQLLHEALAVLARLTRQVEQYRRAHQDARHGRTAGEGPARMMARIDQHVFSATGEDCYQLTCEALGVAFTVDRIRRERHELNGELAVTCLLPGARTVDGYLSVADFNLSSAHSRAARAKLLAERSDAPDLDWHGLIEELCIRTITAERQGSPSRLLHTFPRASDPDEGPYDVDGWPWLRHHPMMTFADGGGLKSMLALYGAGQLARQGVRVGYLDWELTGEDHLERLARMYPAPLPEIHYFRCDRPLVSEADRIAREARRLGLDYLIYDSAGFATAGPPEDAEHALAYFRAVRQIGLGSHHLAHVNKSEHADKKPFGSSFWHNSARATWYAKQADPGVDDTRRVVGLYNRKSNLTRLSREVGFEFDFSQPGVTTVRRVDLGDVQELAADLPVWRRVLLLLKEGGGRPRTLDEIAEELGEKLNTVRHAVSPKRVVKGGRPSIFTTVPGSDGKPRIALVDRRPA